MPIKKYKLKFQKKNKTEEFNDFNIFKTLYFGERVCL